MSWCAKRLCSTRAFSGLVKRQEHTYVEHQIQLELLWELEMVSNLDHSLQDLVRTLVSSQYLIVHVFINETPT